MLAILGSLLFVVPAKAAVYWDLEALMPTLYQQRAEAVRTYVQCISKIRMTHPEDEKIRRRSLSYFHRFADDMSHEPQSFYRWFSAYRAGFHPCKHEAVDLRSIERVLAGPAFANFMSTVQKSIDQDPNHLLTESELRRARTLYFFASGIDPRALKKGEMKLEKKASGEWGWRDVLKEYRPWMGEIENDYGEIEQGPPSLSGFPAAVMSVFTGR